MCETLEDAKEAKALEFSIGAGQVRVAFVSYVDVQEDARTMTHIYDPIFNGPMSHTLIEFIFPL